MVTCWTLIKLFYLNLVVAKAIVTQILEASGGQVIPCSRHSIVAIRLFWSQHSPFTWPFGEAVFTLVLLFGICGRICVVWGLTIFPQHEPPLFQMQGQRGNGPPSTVLSLWWAQSRRGLYVGISSYSNGSRGHDSLHLLHDSIAPHNKPLGDTRISIALKGMVDWS